MSSAELAREIADLEQEATTLTTQLDGMISPCRTELVAPATEWIRQHVRRRIEDYADAVQKLGVEKVRTLKGKVEKLVAQLTQVIEEETGPTTWPHKAKVEDPTKTGYESAGTSEPYFQGVFRSVISRLGAILAEFGLEKGRGGFVDEWKAGKPGQYRYGYNPGFETRNHSNLSAYGLAHVTLLRKQTMLREKRADLEKAKARELWDSA